MCTESLDTTKIYVEILGNSNSRYKILYTIRDYEGMLAPTTVVYYKLSSGSSQRRTRSLESFNRTFTVLTDKEEKSLTDYIIYDLRHLPTSELYTELRRRGINVEGVG